MKPNADTFAGVATPEARAGLKPAPTRFFPTASGFIWLMASFGALLTAINYANNIAFALAFLLFSLWLSIGWECLRNFRGLAWIPVAQPSAFAGETLHLSGTLRTSSIRPHTPFKLCVGNTPDTHGTAAVPHRGEGVRLELSLPAPGRGPHRIDGLSLVSKHPSGLWQARCALPPVTALIYPRPAPPVPGSLLPKEAPRPARRKQESDDFQELRSYMPGDPPRRINWRMYARRGELAVNSYDGGTGGNALCLDIAACEGNTEERLSRLCQWVLEADRQGLEYALALRDGTASAAGQGSAHRKECLDRLAHFGNLPSPNPISPRAKRFLFRKGNSNG